jgi:4-hydroxyphenylpyruvate dioxygenase
VERKNCADPFPDFVPHQKAVGGNNALGFTCIDHVTSNFKTMSPALLWMEHVLGLEHFWEVKFHTDDVKKDTEHGSGLRSVVMWDPHSKVKFANNEPWRPHFRSSQIHIFTEELKGDGIQHVALSVNDIIPTVQLMRQRGIEFMPTPGKYYDAMPERIKRFGVQKIDEPIETLRNLEILVDGNSAGSYLLQIFMKDSATLYKEKDAGPFFYEIIQRKGNQGFGEGNFRALFESIETEQLKERRM